ncbi:MBL fold metallo-hydrolase [Clostridium sp. MB40-C1]|uniref:MBL fold metallo-hydrolase n=1 Tax=Clostridium sp. MB40-C1 TaxID=3070996 RepID=UPI0027E1F687|nr:MBL fold metallo-hydrolase [Clostridium sp. MB40-C1]WMJ80057.1 MBL fold metallo-hydrolase [Clostridium sp. MB40-C1]
MKITVIGCYGGFPSKNEACSGYLVESGEHKVLIDCGSGVLSLIQNYVDINKIDAIILSHYHGDHISDIYCFQYEMAIAFAFGLRNKPLEIYAHKLNGKFQELNYKNFCVAKEINENTTLNFGKLNITFKWMNHEEPSLGMRLEENGKVLAYSGDTGWCDNIIKISQNADVFLCEASLLNEYVGKIQGHLSGGQAGKIASNSGVKELVLTHFPHFIDLNQLEKEAAQEYNGSILKAKKGLVLEL